MVDVGSPAPSTPVKLTPMAKAVFEPGTGANVLIVGTPRIPKPVFTMNVLVETSLTGSVMDTKKSTGRAPVVSSGMRAGRLTEAISGRTVSSVLAVPNIGVPNARKLPATSAMGDGEARPT